MPKHRIEDLQVIEGILGEAVMGHLATCQDGQPYIIPLNFLYRDGRIYFHSRSSGRKLDNIAANPRVCFEVAAVTKLHRAPSACDYSCRYQSVIAFGTAHFVDDLDRKLAILDALVAKHSLGQAYEPVDPHQARKVTVVEIRIESITGKENVDR